MVSFLAFDNRSIKILLDEEESEYGKKGVNLKDYFDPRFPLLFKNE